MSAYSHKRTLIGSSRLRLLAEKQPMVYGPAEGIVVRCRPRVVVRIFF